MKNDYSKTSAVTIAVNKRINDDNDEKTAVLKLSKCIALPIMFTI